MRVGGAWTAVPVRRCPATVEVAATVEIATPGGAAAPARIAPARAATPAGVAGLAAPALVAGSVAAVAAVADTGAARLAPAALVAGPSRAGTPRSGHSRRDRSSTRVCGCCRPGGPGRAPAGVRVVARVIARPGCTRRTWATAWDAWRRGRRRAGPLRVRPVRIRPDLPERDPGPLRGVGPARLLRAGRAPLAGPVTRLRLIVVARFRVHGVRIPVVRGTAVNPVPLAAGFGVTTFHRAPPEDSESDVPAHYGIPS
ncbi:MAG: hypothetical protein ABSF03_16030 [Streptosporangiaceae bacterium]